jgi:alkylation response protein AidB-like acyl-CoA dehydrogenase
VDFDYSDDQKFLKDEARKFLAARCAPSVVRGVLDDPARSYDAGLWSAVAEQGWLGAAIPEQYNGLGLGRVELCAIAEELGRAVAPIPFASTVYVLAEAVMAHGTDAQKAAILPRIAAGELIGCLAVSEGPGTITASALSAKVEAGKLTGAETLESLDPSRGVARLTFDGATAERLGEAGQGFELVQAILDRAAVLLAFEQLGGADRCLEMAREYALGRYAFGRVIAGYQAMKHKMADMYVKNEVARSNAYYGAWALDVDAPELPTAAAAARIAASEAFWFASKESVQVHGGMGFTWDVDCHLYYRRSRQLSLVAGSPKLWKERLVSELEKKNAA